MKISKNILYPALQLLVGVLEKKQTLPILSSILFKAHENQLTLLATDLEVELCATVELAEPVSEPQSFTVPGRKLVDICRVLPEEMPVEIQVNGTTAVVRSTKSEFKLVTLPAEDFPNFDEGANEFEFSLGASVLHSLLARTHFAMAQQDIRYYLNGVMLVVESDRIKAIATNGHRLAATEVALTEIPLPTVQKFILPRKAVVELMRLLEGLEEKILFALGPQHIRVTTNTSIFSSKLIEGQAPDFYKVIPKLGDKQFSVATDTIKSLLQRISVLSTDKAGGVELRLTDQCLTGRVLNQDQESAEESLDIDYQLQPLTVGFNIRYLLDVLNIIPEGETLWTFCEPNYAVVIQPKHDANTLFVVMPMRL